MYRTIHEIYSRKRKVIERFNLLKELPLTDKAKKQYWRLIKDIKL